MTKGQWHRILTQLGGDRLDGMYGVRFDFLTTYDRFSVEVCVIDDNNQKLKTPKLVCFDWKWDFDNPTETDLTNYTQKELVDFVKKRLDK